MTAPNRLTAARAARAEARAYGAKTYHGLPCHAGHGDVRYTSNGTCVQCAKAQRAAQTLRLKADDRLV